MRLKRFLSILLLSVYLFAVGGQAYSVLTCQCVSMKGHTAHFCCHHCAHTAASGTALKAPCCNDHHDTEEILYTASSLDTERSVTKVIPVVDLPIALVAQLVVSDSYIPSVSDNLFARCVLPVRSSGTMCVGLRAPPVLA
ncbi:MAG: hypothetical protein RR182_04750 [Alistipes sp.]